MCPALFAGYLIRYRRNRLKIITFLHLLIICLWILFFLLDGGLVEGYPVINGLSALFDEGSTTGHEKEVLNLTLFCGIVCPVLTLTVYLAGFLVIKRKIHLFGS